MARLLIIDDDVDIQAMLQMTFRDKRHDEVLLTTNAEQGLHSVERDRPELIFVSLFLAGADVLTLTTQLQAGTSAPILLYGSLTPPEETRFAALGSQVVYLPSPLEVTELLTTRDRLLKPLEP